MKKPALFPKYCFLAATLVVAGISPAMVLSVSQSTADSNSQSDGSKADPTKSTTVEHDMAPWDGPAFGLWIPAKQYGGKPDSWIYLRIWEAPEHAQKKFVFPTSEAGTALGAVRYYLDLKTPNSIKWGQQPFQELTGWVRFSESRSDKPVLGEFDFVSEEKVSLKGQFKAAWINNGRLLNQPGQDGVEESR